ncbi:DUF4402 domain-containing protein [Roseateles sp.]|uniref:DUF4402 domain-containing protein n=1 Tax=Roseateles sp. TaxID=1971397 RepID=UPI0040367DE9
MLGPAGRLALPCVMLLASLGTPAQTLSNSGALSFGGFTAGSGGTVSVGTGGTRSKTGSVILVNQAGIPSAAQFVVSGTPNAAFTISLPADGSIFLSDGASGSMAVNAFVSSPAGVGVLSGGGTQQINVGATLDVGSGQATGNYAGSFIVTINYQ